MGALAELGPASERFGGTGRLPSALDGRLWPLAAGAGAGAGAGVGEGGREGKRGGVKLGDAVGVGTGTGTLMRRIRAGTVGGGGISGGVWPS